MNLNSVSSESQESEGPSLFGKVAIQCMMDSDAMFPNVSRSVNHHALALAGEVGEFCNIIKKVDRGDLDPEDPQVRHDIAMELTDILIYLSNLAGRFQIDLYEAYKIKRAYNLERFGGRSNGSGPDAA